MTDKEKDKLISEVMSNFNFKKAYILDFIFTSKGCRYKSLSEMRQKAERMLRLTLDANKNDWWISYGNFVSYYSHRWGLVLNYRPFYTRYRIKKEAEK